MEKEEGFGNRGKGGDSSLQSNFGREEGGCNWAGFFHSREGEGKDLDAGEFQSRL